jgi:hypothetical protein
MAKQIPITNPLTVPRLTAAYPRATRGMGEPEIHAFLEMLEHALRSQFGVTSSSAITNTALSRAMLAAWPSFLIQIRQITSESTNAEGSSTTYATSADSFAFPAFVSTVLAPFIDADAGVAAPSTTRLERDDG